MEQMLSRCACQPTWHGTDGGTSIRNVVVLATNGTILLGNAQRENVEHFFSCLYIFCGLFIWHTSHCALILELSWESAEQTSDFSAHLFFSFLPFHCSFPLCKDQYHTDHYRDSTIALPCERATNTCIHSIDRVFVWVCVCLCLNSAAELMLYDSTAAFPLSKGKRQRGKMPEEKSKSFIDLESEKEVRWAL